MATHQFDAMRPTSEGLLADRLPVSSFADFYRTGPHAAFPQEHRQNETCDIQLFIVDQEPHNLTDSAFHGWILGLPLRASCLTKFNYGHGWRQIRRHGGDALLVPPRTEVNYAIHGPTRLLVLTWTETVWRALADDVLETPEALSPLFERYFRSTQLETLCKSIWSDLARNDAPSRLLLSSAATQLAGMLLRCAKSPILHQKSRRADIRRALAFIHDNLTKDISLTEIAAASGLSTFHFSREFRIQTGHAPISYVRAKRLEVAVSLMRQSGHDMEEIARRSGFATVRRLRDAMSKKSSDGG